MIAQLTGIAARTTSGFVVLDVNGVGYKVNVPVTVLETLPTPGEPVTLLTQMIVREDDISLYGFRDETELRLFDLLLTVTGIGPKVALALLSALPALDLAGAIGRDDTRTLTRVPGIGAKTAQRMVLELKDKVTLIAPSAKATTTAPTGVKSDAVPSMTEDVVSALVNLGYNKADAQRATEAVATDLAAAGSQPKFADLLRAALNRMTGHR